MNKVYIAGPMSNIEDANRPAFNLAAEKLSAAGYIVLNPAVLPAGLTEPEYMDICLAMIRCVDEVYLLRGWQSSAGAIAEYHLAYKLALRISEQH